MTNDNEAEQLAEELDKISSENKKFITDTDAKIERADLRYAQMLIEEDTNYLKLAQKIKKQQE